MALTATASVGSAARPLLAPVGPGLTANANSASAAPIVVLCMVFFMFSSLGNTFLLPGTWPPAGILRTQHAAHGHRPQAEDLDLTLPPVARVGHAQVVAGTARDGFQCN